ncbi:MAG: polysaccharide biosynthesis protein [Clostridia bacterium]|nr:polysaccharide biosynthesis protein [Clostridia bacterium]
MSQKNERKEQSLLVGAGVLTIASLIVKGISALYKLPLTNYLLGIVGIAYFTRAYAIYTPLYSISMAGLPIAVSKLVAQNVELGKVRDARRIFNVSRKLFFLVGIFGTVLLAAIALPYSKYLIKSPESVTSILAIAPCIVFCCMMSSFRGYYEGLKNMTPTSVSQVIEALVKLVFGLAATWAFISGCKSRYAASNVGGVATILGRSVSSEAELMEAIYPYASAVAIFGVTLGSMVGLLYLYIHYKRKGFGFTREELVNSPPPKSDKVLRNQIIKIATPIAISSLIVNVSNIIDDVMIGNRLDRALKVGGDVIKNMYQYSLAASETSEVAIKDYLYGLHASVVNVKNLIPTITISIGVSVIPILSAAWAAKNKHRIKVTVESALRITSMLALPAGLGIAALSEPILRLLYSKQTHIIPIAAPMLCVYGFGMIMFSIASPITNMLQAVGRMDIPLKSVAIGSVVKIVLNFILIGNPQVNINGAVWSTMVCYIVMLSINFTALLKVTKVKLDYASVFIKPLIAATACGLAALFSYSLLAEKLSRNGTISTLLAICVGAAFYAAVLLLLKGIARDDVEMLPKGEKIAKALEKFGLLG